MQETKEIEAKARQRRRLKAKIKGIVTNHEAVFISMSFKDEYLKATTEEQRERDIKRFLSSQLDIYIANKDFGEKNKREHYHALGVAIANKTIKNNLKREKRLYGIKDHINLKAFASKYGRIKARFIQKPKASANDEEKALYWKKTTEDLYNHFTKESAQGSRIIHGRTKPKTWQEQIKRLEAIAKAEEESRKKRKIYFDSLKTDEQKEKMLKRWNNKAVLTKDTKEEQSESDYIRFIDEATETD